MLDYTIWRSWEHDRHKRGQCFCWAKHHLDKYFLDENNISRVFLSKRQVLHEALVHGNDLNHTKKTLFMRQLQITYDGPQFVELSCSDKPTQAELISTKVRDNVWPFTLKHCFHPIQGTGKDGLYFCGSDWCNSSKKTLPLTVFVVILSILSAFHWNKYVIAKDILGG